MMGAMISRHQAGVEYRKQRGVCVGSVLHKEDEMLLLMCCASTHGACLFIPGCCIVAACDMLHHITDVLL